VTGIAPGRVNLIGEHLDYLGGRCLPMALSQTTSARVTLREDDRLVLTSGERSWEGSAADLSPESVEGWPAYVAGVLWALDVRAGMDVAISSDVPVGAGLSSSAALECSVAVAVDAALSLGTSGDELVTACIRAENEFVGAPTGGLDQAVSVFGEVGHGLLVDFAGHGQRRELVPFAPAAHGLALLVVDTRVEHAMTDGSYGQRRDETDDAARRLGVALLAEACSLPASALAALPSPLDRRARYVVEEMARVDAFASALRSDDWDAVGPLMDASHAGASHDYEISCEELDVTVEIAREAGAVGARMTGGGFGGSAIALVPSERVQAVRAAVATGFAARGWREPGFIEAQPGAGAHLS